MDQLWGLIYQHLCRSFEKQQQLTTWQSKFGKDLQHAVDSNTATLLFRKKKLFGSDTRTLHINVLGIVFPDHSMLWTWANEEQGLPVLPTSVTEAAYKMKELANQESIEMFQMPVLPPGQFGIHGSALVMIGMLKADAYFCTSPLSNGAALLLAIFDEQLRIAERNPIWTISEVFPQAMQVYPVAEPMKALAGYLASYGFGTELDKSTVIGRHDKYGEFQAHFDENQQMISCIFPRDAMPPA